MIAAQVRGIKRKYLNSWDWGMNATNVSNPSEVTKSQSAFFNERMACRLHILKRENTTAIPQKPPMRKPLDVEVVVLPWSMFQRGRLLYEVGLSVSSRLRKNNSTWGRPVICGGLCLNRSFCASIAQGSHLEQDAMPTGHRGLWWTTVFLRQCPVPATQKTQTKHSSLLACNVR